MSRLLFQNNREIVIKELTTLWSLVVIGLVKVETYISNYVAWLGDLRDVVGDSQAAIFPSLLVKTLVEMELDCFLFVT